MSGAPPSPREFYTTRVPAQFNRTLEARLESGGPVASLTAVDATLCVVVEGPDGDTFYLDIHEGRMTPAKTPAHAPFMTLVHDSSALEALERESGDSILGFLAGLAGLEEDLQLTVRRVENLIALHGSLRFELTGPGGFELLGHFGDSPLSEEPVCTIRLDRETHGELRSGALSPEAALLGGRVEVEGDLQMAIGLALAALAPD